MSAIAGSSVGDLIPDATGLLHARFGLGEPWSTILEISVFLALLGTVFALVLLS